MTGVDDVERRAKIRAAVRRYEERHRERVKARRAKYRAENAERLREERQVRYYADHAETLAQAKIWSKKGRQARIARGQCVNCQEPAVPDRRMCAACLAKASAYAVEHQVYRRYRYKTLYGLTREALADLLAQQENRCAICNAAFDLAKARAFVIDHDHESGAVRGALCQTCNTAIGLLRDSAELVDRAASYLRAKQLKIVEAIS